MPRIGYHIDRRTALSALLTVPIASACGTANPRIRGFDKLEDHYGARVGLFAVNTKTGRALRHREHERFGMCSTFKTYAVAAVLREHPLNSDFYRRVVHFDHSDVVVHSPVTEKRVGRGMSWFELCEAAITYSDNTAANLLLRELGGPAAIGRFARSLGDEATRLDRWEPELNDVERGDKRDTTTPLAIATGYRALLTEDALRPREREQLTNWLVANTTGKDQIRLGLPGHWRIGDKTGSGFYGRLNDIAVTWNYAGDPLIIAALSDHAERDADTDTQLMAEIGRTVADRLS